MNSRLGFDLLPDLKTLERPPKVVVQLHVEEHADGYVRYVTTRYGNLVDAFSLSSRHLADAVHDDYGVSRDRIAVIPTGVDAERSSPPERVRRGPGLEPEWSTSSTRAGWPPEGPLMMVEVALPVGKKQIAERRLCRTEVRVDLDRAPVMFLRGF